MWLCLWNAMLCHALQLQIFMAKTKLVWPLRFVVFFFLLGTLPSILAAMLTGIKSWSEEFCFFLRHKKMHKQLKLHLSRHVARINVFLLQSKITHIELTTIEHTKRTKRVLLQHSKIVEEKYYTQNSQIQVTSTERFKCRASDKYHTNRAEKNTHALQRFPFIMWKLIIMSVSRIKYHISIDMMVEYVFASVHFIQPAVFVRCTSACVAFHMLHMDRNTTYT